MVMDIERTMEFILEMQAKNEVAIDKLAQSSARHDREMAEIRLTLRRAIRAAVIEARDERKKRRELDARVAAQMQHLTESPSVSSSERRGRTAIRPKTHLSPN